jgi:hypothetical protein
MERSHLSPALVQQLKMVVVAPTLVSAAPGRVPGLGGAYAQHCGQIPDDIQAVKMDYETLRRYTRVIQASALHLYGLLKITGQISCT